MSSTDTTATSQPLPAAWYRDPSCRHERRWWDGEEWTDRVADGDQVTSDPPVRSRPTAPAAETPEVEPQTAPGPVAEEVYENDVYGDAQAAESTPRDGAEDEPQAFVGVDEGRGGSRPPADRRSTGGAQSEGPGRGIVIAAALAAIAVTASLFWGVQNHQSASQWRDRGEELETQLVTRQSNVDSLEEALSQAASRGARLADDQQAFNELRDTAVTTVDQIRSCALDLSHVIIALQSGADPTAPLEQAGRSCESASMNGEMLIQVLDEVAGS